MYIYYPSCNFNRAHPQTGRIVRSYFKDKMEIAKCCLIDQREIQDEDIGIYICQNCRTQIENKIKTKSIWEYFDELNDFTFPNYQGQIMQIQDCYRDRNHPEVHQSVRNLLKKMNIQVLEILENKAHSTFCGTLHYETKDPDLLQAIANYPDTKLSHLPESLQQKLMQEQVHKFDPNYPIICDCNRCLKGIELGGGKGVHLLDLIMNPQI